MLAHVPSFGRNPRGSPDFLAYPVPKACMHVLGTGVPRCLGVARSASSPKAAQALGCSLTPGLQISFGWVTCMARAPAWMQTEALLPFCNKGWGSKHDGSIFNTPILEAHYLWGKVHISAILAWTYLWIIEERKYE